MHGFTVGFSHRMLRITSGITATGAVQGELVLALLVAWILTFFCLFKGIKTSGKVHSKRKYAEDLSPYMFLWPLPMKSLFTV